MDQWPAWSSSSRAKTDGPSKRGKHSQSTEPARLTSAAERQSDSKAYSAIGKLLMISLLFYSYLLCMLVSVVGEMCNVKQPTYLPSVCSSSFATTAVQPV